MPSQIITRHLHYWMMLAVAASGSLAVGAPPVDVGSAGRSHSRTDRALESRAGILNSSRSAGTPDSNASEARSSAASAGGSASGASSFGATASSQTSANSGGTTGTTASESGRSTAANARAVGTGAPNGVMTDRSRRPEASFSLNGETSRGRQSENATRGSRGLDRAAAHTDRASKGAGAAAGQARTHGTQESPEQPQDSTKEPRKFSLISRALSSRTEKFKKGKSDSAKTAALTRSHSDEGSKSQATQADQFLTRRLAQIDRMRDEALASGDTDKLREADRLELLARSQYSQKTTGERKVGSAMKEFNRQSRPTEVSADTAPSVETEATTDSDTSQEPDVQ